MDKRSAIRTVLIALFPTLVVLWPLPVAATYGLLAVFQPRRITLPQSVTTPAVLFTGVLLASSLMSQRGWQTVVDALPIVAGLALLALFVTRVSRTDAGAAVVGTLLLLVINLAVSMHQVHFLGFARATGLTFHANLLAAITVVSMWTLMVPGSGQRWSGVLRLAGLLVGVFTVIYSASRGGTLASLTAVLAMALVAATRRKDPAGQPTLARNVRFGLLAVSIALAAALVGQWAGLWNLPIIGRFSSTGDLASGLGRPLLWSAALDLLAQRPILGFGPNAWGEYIGLVEPVIRSAQIPHVHNQFLDIGLWAGLVGISLAVWIFGSVVAAIWSSRHDVAGWAEAGMATVAAGVVVCLFDTPASHIQVLMLAGLTVGLALPDRAAQSVRSSVVPVVAKDSQTSDVNEI